MARDAADSANEYADWADIGKEALRVGGGLIETTLATVAGGPYGLYTGALMAGSWETFCDLEDGISPSKAILHGLGAGAGALIGGKLLGTVMSRFGLEAIEEAGAGGSRVLKSGGRIINTTSEFFATEAEANQAYAAISSRSDDVAAIAENIGWKPWKIQRIKAHLFHNVHDLGGGSFGRFDPDIEISDAWYRLIDGRHVDSDIDLLRHELFEAKFEGILRTDYDAAHRATLRSGRGWAP